MIMTKREQFRRLLGEPGIQLQPVVYDPLGARIAEDVGFGMIALGGYAVGAHLAITEPLASLDDFARITRSIGLVCRPADHGRCRRRLWRAAPRHAHGARARAGGRRLHPPRGPVLPQARPLSPRHRGGHPGRGDGRKAPRRPAGAHRSRPPHRRPHRRDAHRRLRRGHPAGAALCRGRRRGDHDLPQRRGGDEGARRRTCPACRSSTSTAPATASAAASSRPDSSQEWGWKIVYDAISA